MNYVCSGILHPTRRIYLFCLQCHSQHWWRLGHAWNSGMSILRAGYITYALSKPNEFHTSEKLHHSYYSLLQLLLMYWWNRTHGSYDADQRVSHPFAADGRGVPHCATLHDPGMPLIQHFQTNHTICWEIFPSLIGVPSFSSTQLSSPAVISCRRWKLRMWSAGNETIEASTPSPSFGFVWQWYTQKWEGDVVGSFGMRLAIANGTLIPSPPPFPNQTSLLSLSIVLDATESWARTWELG